MISQNLSILSKEELARLILAIALHEELEDVEEIEEYQYPVH